MPVAEIITIGTELLLGETVDTNTQTIALALRDLGINLYRSQTIGDNQARIAEIVREALGRADIIITTGGLGPTVDDPTRQAVAQALGVKLEFHPELWQQIIERIARYGRTPTENQKQQAYIPHGAIPVENPVGTAPAFIAITDRKAIICLPGVPREMETLFDQAVIPFLKKRFRLKEIIQVRILHVSGIGEGVVDDRIGDLEVLTNPTVGLTAHAGIIDIRIAAKARNIPKTDQLIAGVESDIRNRLGAYIFGVDDATLEGVTLDMLKARDWTLACFEAGTGAALLQRLSRTKHPAYLGGEEWALWSENLAEAIAKLKSSLHASIGLGVAAFTEDKQTKISILVLTQCGQEECHLTYGGHPQNLPRWSANMALDFLRRTLVHLTG